MCELVFIWSVGVGKAAQRRSNSPWGYDSSRFTVDQRGWFTGMRKEVPSR